MNPERMSANPDAHPGPDSLQDQLADLQEDARRNAEESVAGPEKIQDQLKSLQEDYDSIPPVATGGIRKPNADEPEPSQTEGNVAPQAPEESAPNEPEQLTETPEQKIARLSREEKDLSAEFDRRIKITLREAEEGQLSESENDRAIRQVMRSLEHVRAERSSLLGSRIPPAAENPATMASTGPTETIPAPPPPGLLEMEENPPRDTIIMSAAEQKDWAERDRGRLEGQRVSKTEPMDAESAQRAISETDPNQQGLVSGEFSVPENPVPKIETLEEDETPPSATAKSERLKEKTNAELTTLREEIAKMERNIATTQEMIATGMSESDTFLSDRKEMLAAKRRELAALEAKLEKRRKKTELASQRADKEAGGEKPNADTAKETARLDPERFLTSADLVGSIASEDERVKLVDQATRRLALTKPGKASASLRELAASGALGQGIGKKELDAKHEELTRIYRRNYLAVQLARADKLRADDPEAADKRLAETRQVAEEWGMDLEANGPSAEAA